MSENLDSLVESHLNLQVKISYSDHHDFLVRHHLNQCSQILDVGTGNGAFMACLAKDHPTAHFIGIDKRKSCIDSCHQYLRPNVEVQQVDMFSRESHFDFSRFDGFLMRYFLLHVDHSQKILELFKQKSKRPCRFWIIDLDYSQFACEPAHQAFDKLTQLVKDFCSKISVHSLSGQKVLSILDALDYKNIIVEHTPFSNQSIADEDLALYLKQEILCYSRMMGRAAHDPDTLEILRFIDEDLKTGNYHVSYGMMLVSAELP